MDDQVVCSVPTSLRYRRVSELGDAYCEQAVALAAQVRRAHEREHVRRGRGPACVGLASVPCRHSRP